MTLMKLKEGVEEYKESVETEEGKGMRELKESVAGLLEYVRLSEGHVHSTFSNPLLVGSGLDGTSLSEYLKWEEKERFLGMFLPSPYYGLLANSCFIPHFGSSILLDGESGLRSPCLGSRDLITDSLQTLHSLLTQKILEAQKSGRSLMTGLAQDFGQLLGRVGKECGCGWESRREVEGWFQGLDSEGDGRQTGLVGSVMVEAGAALMELAAALPLVDPAVEKEILARYLTDEVSLTLFHLQYSLLKSYERMNLSGLS